MEYARVCSAHFTAEDYISKGSFDKDGKYVVVQTATLRPAAVPSLFDFGGYSRGLLMPHSLGALWFHQDLKGWSADHRKTSRKK